MKQPKLPSLSTVKKALYADWALRVKQRDGWKCLLCGAMENLTAHHWYVSDHHAHAARYCVHNGATLCYACHIRGIHQRADYVSVAAVHNAVNFSVAQDSEIRILVNVELTTEVLRKLWNEMRARPVSLAGVSHRVHPRGKRLFLYTFTEHPIAAAGNTITVPSDGVHEVLTVAKTDKGYRYTVRKIEEAGK